MAFHVAQEKKNKPVYGKLLKRFVITVVFRAKSLLFSFKSGFKEIFIENVVVKANFVNLRKWL